MIEVEVEDDAWTQALADPAALADVDKASEQLSQVRARLTGERVAVRR